MRTRQVTGLATLAAAALLCGCASASSGLASATRAATTGPASSSSPVRPSQSAQPARSASSSPAAAGSCAGSPAAAGGGAAPAALQAVQFTDQAHGWAAGAGRIMATGDGGRSWARQYAGPAALDQVDFTDAAHGWAVGPGALLRTVDGGARWTSLGQPNVNGQCLTVGSVHFVSPTSGWAVAGPRAGAAAAGAAATGNPPSGGRLLRTADGGQTWSAVPAAPAGAQSVCFGSAAAGYLGTPGKVYRTSDGGTTWTLAFTEPPVVASQTAGGKTPGDIPELQCAGQQAAWVLFLGSGVAMGHAPYLAYATATGSGWRAVLEETMIESSLRPGVHAAAGTGSEPGPFSVISADSAVFVGFTPPANGYGAAPVQLASAGGARVTGVGTVGAINQPLAAAFLSADRGWVVGENLKTNTFQVEATSDGGRSWATQYTVK
jgi:photosystem II stability/assembly factor-like uncharacterized protein